MVSFLFGLVGIGAQILELSGPIGAQILELSASLFAARQSSPKTRFANLFFVKKLPATLMPKPSGIGAPMASLRCSKEMRLSFEYSACLSTLSKTVSQQSKIMRRAAKMTSALRGRLPPQRNNRSKPGLSI